MIEVTNLSKVFTRIISTGNKKLFGKKEKVIEEEFLAVNNISFKAEKGEIIGILGPNGAGKTTLLRMLAGILTPTSGDIEICGYNYNEDKNLAKKEIGYLSGNTRLYGRFSPREIMTIFGKMYEMDEKSIKNSIERISNIMNMDEFIDNRIENLSTGQTQRTSIARCLIHSPSVYIFDEPTLGLDILSSRSIIDFMIKEKQEGKTVLYSTHYMKEAETLCDRILLIYEGKIIAEGNPNDLMKNTNSKSLRQVFIKLAEKEVTLYED
ncbi:ABC transporter ATP-binding protein [Peptacetobacter sp.]|uniref:ABC transporter ATP-binding protein n=1 Tax=Peptacetobacter sp. TaxID=2991975 RepID=UPI00261C5968|nr:ABC transporter ATP-binding protein [Peptacetobacter sp.]